VRAIPSAIKIEIFRCYLEGLSIPQINNLYKVSVGTISTIITEEIKNNDFIQFFREIAKVIKKNNSSSYDLISAIHLNSIIEKLGLSSDFFENFLELADTTSFRLNMNIDEYFNKINYIINFEKSTQIRIHDIFSLIEKEKNELEELHREKEMIEKEITNSCHNIGLPKSWILDYIKQKPLFIKYKKNTDTFYKSLEWTTYPSLFEKANNQIERNIDPNILYNKLLTIYTKPHENAELIRTIFDYEQDLLLTREYKN
jgi:hypothetical protein